MRFLGIELSGIAGYAKQFISVGNGINLIVGRNNVGKTAMLSASTVLRYLPVGTSGCEQVPPEVLEYSNASSGFEFSVCFLADSPDAPNIDKRQAVWQQTLASQNLRLIYKFRVNAQGWVLLSGVVAQFAGHELYVVRMAENGVGCTRYWYDTQSGACQEGRQQGSGGGIVVEGGTATTYPHDDIFGHLVPLKTLEFVGGHRVFSDFQALRTVTKLGSNAQELGPYLQWLQGASPKQFNQIQEFLTQLFPEFEYINVESVLNNQVTIRFTMRGGGQKVQLSRCGTGVEQVLALASFVIASEPNNLICVDEPHAFLHPTAERLLLEFLHKHTEHNYLITTHSAIFINSVPSTQITHLSGKGYGIDEYSPCPVAQLLFDLGYKNSDLLFADRVVFVEGETDQQVLPILLAKAGISANEIATAGFCKLKGSGNPHTITRQSEDLLTALHKDEMPRLYLFDGDKKPNKDYFQKIKNTRTGREIPISFLLRTEIENYLLDPIAIAAAITEEKQISRNGIESVQISDQVRRWLESGIKKFGSNGKGSQILDYLYEEAKLRFKKTEHCRLIALHTNLESNPALKELITSVSSVFGAVNTDPK